MKVKLLKIIIEAKENLFKMLLKNGYAAYKQLLELGV